MLAPRTVRLRTDAGADLGKQAGGRHGTNWGSTQVAHMALVALLRKPGAARSGTHGANWASTQVADMAHVCHAVAHMARSMGP